MRELVNNQYSRNDTEIARGRFRMKGDVLEIGPAYEDRLVRVELFGDEVEAIRYVDPTTGEILQSLETVNIYPPTASLPPKTGSTRRSVPFARNCAIGWTFSMPKASCWRPSGWSSAPSTTWRCWGRWATAMAWRTTPVTLPAARRAPAGVPDRLLPRRLALIVDESHVTCSSCRRCTTVTRPARRC